MNNKVAFEALYNEYFDRAMRTAKGLLRDEYLAADAVQETFVRVYRNLEKYDKAKPFEPWFNKILVNECKRIGSKMNKVVYLDTYPETCLIDQELEKDLEQVKEFEKVLGSLGEKIKIPIMLKYVQGLKVDEIADIMNLNTNTVKSRLLFGRNKLKGIYSKQHKEVR